MEFKKVLVMGFEEKELEPSFWQRIDAVSEKREWSPLESKEVKTHLANTECLLVKFNPPVPKDWIDAAPNLKYIGAFATGYGKIDHAYAKEKGIVVTNVPGYATESVAEFVFATILEHLRDLERAKAQARKGDFSELSFSATELKGKTFGVIGLGRIGSRVAQIAQGFGANVRYWDRNRKTELEKIGIEYKEENEVIAESDFLSIHLALTPETRVFFDAQKIEAIKPGAVVVNTAPMELIAVDALVGRLKKGDITFIWDHPDETDKKDVERLMKFKNCITYPPIGYISKEAMVNKQEIFTRNIEAFIEGKPQNVVK